MCHVSDMSQYTRYTCAFVHSVSFSIEIYKDHAWYHVALQSGNMYKCIWTWNLCSSFVCKTVCILKSPHAMLIYAFGILEFRQVLQWVPKNWSEKRREISPSIYLSINQETISYLSIHRPTHFWIDDGSMKHDLTSSQSRHGRHVWTMALLETSHALTVEKQFVRKTWPASWQQIFLFHNLNCVQIFGWNPPHQGHLVIKKLVIVGGLFLRISSPKGIPYVLVDLSSQESSNPKRVGLRTSAETHHFSPPCFQHQSCCSGFRGQTAPLHLGVVSVFGGKRSFFCFKKRGGGTAF